MKKIILLGFISIIFPFSILAANLEVLPGLYKIGNLSRWDNCPRFANADQADTDFDGMENAHNPYPDDPSNSSVLDISINAKDWFIYDDGGAINNGYDPELGQDVLITEKIDGGSFGIAHSGKGRMFDPGLNIIGKPSR